MKTTRPPSPAHGELTTASPLKLAAAKVLAGDATGRVLGALTGHRVRHQGLWFDVRSHDFSPSVRAQMFWGIYEGAETRMIHAFIRDRHTVVELGSSLGVTTAHIAAGMIPGGRLISVEANPALIPGLRGRLSPWARSLHLDVIHAAVTTHCGSTLLTIAPQTVDSRLGDPREDEDTVPVPALTLRQILDQASLADFDLVSDIEGAEAAFLLRDPSTLAQCRRAVIELHETTLDGSAVSVFDLIDALTATGLEIVHRHGPVVAAVRR
jgi:FkbM family methyltransferase